MPRPLYRQQSGMVPTVQEAGWAPGPASTDGENFAPWGFDPQTFQPEADRYIDYAIPVHI